jgi:hypothetical protein
LRNKIEREGEAKQGYSHAAAAPPEARKSPRAKIEWRNKRNSYKKGGTLHKKKITDI